MTALSIAVARAMGIPNDKIGVIARGAFLHDIGKLAIPDAILLKPSKFTYDEMKLMKEHSFLGYHILRKIPFLAECAEIVYAHHERFDGSGYPRGLKGEEIPIGARIVAVAETLDAMRSDLPYRPALSYDKAREEIIRWSGRQFDPEVVRVYLSIPEKMWDDLREQIIRASQKVETNQTSEGA